MIHPVTGLLLMAFIASPALSQVSSFSDDLKTGQVFSFKQKAQEISQYVNDIPEYRLDYTRWLPEQSNGQVLVYNHGLQSHRAWFYRTAETLRDMGYTVYALDRVGSGTSSSAYAIEGYRLGLEDFIPYLDDVSIVTKRGHIQDYHTHLTSIDRMLDIVANENPDQPIHLWANSYGSKLITRYLLDEKRANRVASAIFTTPGLFRNKVSMPLPFSKIDLVLGKNSDEFPSPVTEQDLDNGASWFTELEPWFSKIKHDPLSVRVMTRKLALQTQSLDKYIATHSPENTAIQSVPRFYLLVNQDPMMDNQKVQSHIEQIKKNSTLKFYQGGKNHKHFLTFTEDAQQVIQDIHHFILGTQTSETTFAGVSQ